MKVTAKNLTNYQVQLEAGGHQFIADEPEDLGDDAGPNPYALLLSALGACKVMTVLMVARRKGWPLEDVEVSLKTYRVHAEDCQDCESDPDAKVTIIEAEVAFKGDLSEDQIQRLREISEHCPVHKTLTSEIKVITRLK